MQVATKSLIGVVLILCCIEPQSTMSQEQNEHCCLKAYSSKFGHGKMVVFYGSTEWLFSSRDEMSRWNEMPDLRQVSLANTNVTKDLIQYVSTLRSVIDFEIGFSPEEIEMLPGAIEPIGEMHWLKRLDIANHEAVDHSDFDFFSKMKSLEFLELSGRPVKFNAFRKILALPSLKELTLLGITGDGIGNDSDLPIAATEILTIRELTDSELVLPILKALPKLCELRVGLPELGDREFAILAQSKSLKKLSVSTKVFSTQNRSITLESLEELEIEVTSGEFLDLTTVARMFPKLRRISVHLNNLQQGREKVPGTNGT